MKKSLRYALLALGCWAVVIYCFTVVAPWTTAVSVADLAPDLQTKANANWRSVVVEHGKVTEWTRGTIRMNPAGFTSYVLALGAFGLFAVLLAIRAGKWHKAEQKELASRSSSDA